MAFMILPNAHDENRFDLTTRDQGHCRVWASISLDFLQEARPDRVVFYDDELTIVTQKQYNQYRRLLKQAGEKPR